MRITVIVHDDDDSDDDEDQMSSTLFKSENVWRPESHNILWRNKGFSLVKDIPGNYRVKACQSVYLSACDTQTEQNDKSLILLIILVK